MCLLLDILTSALASCPSIYFNQAPDLHAPHNYELGGFRDMGCTGNIDDCLMRNR
jgi:hypothetical protein